MAHPELVILETKRLFLRRLQIDDAPILARLWSDPEVTRFEGGPREFAQVAKSLQDDAGSGQPDPFDMWTLVEKPTNRVIGHCGLVEKEVQSRQEIEVTYTLARQVWGRGYATEIVAALRDYVAIHLNRTRLIALIDPENMASKRVAQKIGMRLDREIVRPGGVHRCLYIWEASP